MEELPLSQSSSFSLTLVQPCLSGDSLAGTSHYIIQLVNNWPIHIPLIPLGILHKPHFTIFAMIKPKTFDLLGAITFAFTHTRIPVQISYHFSSFILPGLSSTCCIGCRDSVPNASATESSQIMSCSSTEALRGVEWSSRGR